MGKKSGCQHVYHLKNNDFLFETVQNVFFCVSNEALVCVVGKTGISNISIDRKRKIFCVFFLKTTQWLCFGELL